MLKMKSVIARTQLLVLLLAAVPLTIVAQEDLLNHDKLSEFGTKKYKMTWLDGRSGKIVERERGTMTLSASQTKDSVSLKNLTRMYMPDGKRFVEYSAKFVYAKSDKKMTPMSLNLKGTRSDEVVLFEIDAKIENGKIIQKSVEGKEEETVEQEWDVDTVTDLSIFFLIPQLSQEVGHTVSIDRVITFPLSPNVPTVSNRIKCLGLDKVTKIDGQECTKFVNNWNKQESGIEYWVDSERRLRRVLLNPENRLDLILE